MIRKRYLVHVCPDCGELHQFTGFCDNRVAHPKLQPRLEGVTVIPIPVLAERASEYDGEELGDANSFLAHLLETG